MPRPRLPKQTTVSPTGASPKDALRVSARLLTLVLSFFALCPIRFHPIANDLDPSWAYALNYAHSTGLVWGRDIGFTYGPWAWFSIAMNVGENLAGALSFQLIAWLALLPVLGYLLIIRKTSATGSLLFLLTLPLGHAALHSFGFANLDHYFSILVTLLLACALVARRWYIPFAAAVATAAVVAMIKFSAGIFCLSALGCFVLALFLQNRRQAVEAGAIAAIGFPLLFTAAYFTHNASFQTMALFVRTSMERSDAYSISNSLPTVPQDLTAAAADFGLFIAFAVVLYLMREKAFYHALALAGPWFFIFKHGFVRSDSHVGIFFAMAGMLWGSIFLVTEFHAKRWWIYATALLPLLLFPQIRTWGTSPTAIIQGLDEKSAALNIESLRKTLEANSSALTLDKLPLTLLQRVGDKSLTPYPWELSYGAANPIRMKPMPMLQSYGADSAFLDAWNAAMFEESTRRPEFVLTEWRAIDNRHLFWDAPATTAALLRWYEFDSAYGPLVLLRKRTQPAFGDLKPLSRTIYNSANLMKLPQSPGAVFGRLKFNLTLRGKLAKFFYKIPEVSATMLTGQGEMWTHRIVPDVFGNTGPLTFMPVSLNDFASGRKVSAVTHIRISGPGADYYDTQVEAEFYTAPNLPAPTGAPIPEAKAGVDTDATRIDFINGEGAAMASKVYTSAPTRIVSVEGWAVDKYSNACAAEVAVEFDGKPMRTVYGLPRPEIPAIVSGNKCLTGGFSWGLPKDAVSPGEHSLRVRVLSTDGSTWHPSSNTITMVLR